MDDAELASKELRALRDFFFARNAFELSMAYRELAETGEGARAIDWKDVEFGFNKLFVGPAAPIAPPYASVYLEPEPRTMGETTLLVRRIYQMLGLKCPHEGVIPDDHISLELDACLHMREGVLNSGSEQLRSLYHYFLNRHMQHWIPAFVTKTCDAAEIPEVIRRACHRLESRLDEERKWVDVSSTPRSETSDQREG